MGGTHRGVGRCGESSLELVHVDAGSRTFLLLVSVGFVLHGS